MADFADLRGGALSTGQKQRTNIARALVADPPILILDEPTLGLDVLSNRVILDFIIRGEGDHTFNELLDALDGRRSIEAVTGLSYKERGEFHHNERRSLHAGR